MRIIIKIMVLMIKMIEVENVNVVSEGGNCGKGDDEEAEDVQFLLVHSL